MTSFKDRLKRFVGLDWDAIAGILILIVNLIGGITVGVLAHELGFGQALTSYGELTIGDGLVAQIQSLSPEQKQQLIQLLKPDLPSDEPHVDSAR